jgi:hypothetical protein
MFLPVFLGVRLISLMQPPSMPSSVLPAMAHGKYWILVKRDNSKTVLRGTTGRNAGTMNVPTTISGYACIVCQQMNIPNKTVSKEKTNYSVDILSRVAGSDSRFSIISGVTVLIPKDIEQINVLEDD